MIAHAKFYRSEMFRAENELGYLLTRLNNTPCRIIEPVYDGLLHRQPQACKNACSHSLSIISGGPGTGKTTTLRAIVASYDNAGFKTAVVCPTGAAAKRASSVINSNRLEDAIPCYTAHSFIGYNPGLNSNKYNRFSKRQGFDAVIMDEMSMYDIILARNTFESLPLSTRVVLVGDHNQLPSVAAGMFASDVIHSGVFPQVVLDKVLRQGEKSGIVQNANRVIKGDKIITTDPETGVAFTDFYFVPRNDHEEARNYISELISKRLTEKRGYRPKHDIQILSPGHQSLVGVKELNKKMQELLNGNGRRVSSHFRVGDKVVNHTNNRLLNLVNGDVGFIEDSFLAKGEYGEPERIFRVDFGSGAGPGGHGIVDLTYEQLSGLSLGYATTVHKSQGCEYPCVLMPLFYSHYMMLYRNLLYTGMTRAKDLLVLVGEKKALSTAIRTNTPAKRMSNLQTILLNAASYFIAS